MTIRVSRKRSRRCWQKTVCLGCGVCVKACGQESIDLKPRAARVITPVNGAQRYVMLAFERGKLQNRVFDNQVMDSHRALAALLGVVLKLPPVNMAMANDQLKSRFVEAVAPSSSKKGLIITVVLL
jgi:ferredoxin